MTTASPTVEPLALILKTNDFLMTKALEGVSDADLARPALPGTNPLLWIFAHAVTTRAGLLKQLGGNYDTGWGSKYSRGAALDTPPSREDALSVASAVSSRLQGQLALLNDEQLAVNVEHLKLPNVKTMAHALGFFALHDSYHVGQMALVRKALGYAQLVG